MTIVSETSTLSSHEALRDAFIAHMMRGGKYGYWWTLKHLPDGTKINSTSWWSVDAPTALPDIEDVYFGVCPSSEARGRKLRAEANHIMAVNAVWVDIDAKDFDGDMAQTLRYLERAVPLAPSVIVKSGNGYHGYWLLDLPYKIENEEQRKYITSITRGWVDLFNGDKVGDLPRILRVPGTINAKPGREKTAVLFERCNLDAVYSLRQIEEVEKSYAVGPYTPAPAKVQKYNADAAYSFKSDEERAARALELLSSYRCDNRAEWIRVGMALRAGLGDHAFNMFDRWSQGSTSYDEKSCLKAWNSFKGTGVGLASLFLWAKEDSPNDFDSIYHDERRTFAKHTGKTMTEIMRPNAVQTVTAEVTRPDLKPLPKIARFRDYKAPDMAASDIVQYLPRTFAKFALELSAATQTPAQMTVWLALAAASSMTMRGLTVDYVGRKEYTNLYLLVIAESGSRKSTIVSKVFEPIQNLEVEEQALESVNVSKYKSMLRMLENRLRKLEDQYAKDQSAQTLNDRDNVINEIEKLKANPVYDPRRIVSGNFTPEALEMRLAENRVLTIANSEGQFFEAGKRYAANNGNNIDVLLHAWDGEQGTIDRTKSSTVIKQGSLLTIGVSTQMQRFHDFMETKENKTQGLVQRFMLVTADKHDTPRDTRAPQMQESTRYAWDTFIRDMKNVRGVVQIKDGTEAEAILHEEEKKNEDRTTKKGWYSQRGDIADGWGSKIFQSGTVRMTGVLAAMFAIDAGEGADSHNWSADTLKKAASAAVFLTDYTREHTMFAYGKSKSGGIIGDAQMLLEDYLPKMGSDRWARRDLLRKVSHKIRTAKELAEVINVLIERGYVLFAEPEHTAVLSNGEAKRETLFVVHPHAYTTDYDEEDDDIITPQLDKTQAMPTADVDSPQVIVADDYSDVAKDGTSLYYVEKNEDGDYDIMERATEDLHSLCATFQEAVAAARDLNNGRIASEGYYDPFADIF